MKSGFLTMAVIAATLTAVCDGVPDRETHLAMRRAAVARRIATEGGHVELVTQGGKVYIVNTQTMLPESVITTAAASIRRTLQLAVDVIDGKASKPEEKRPVLITLSESSDDATLLVAPEQCRAFINVRALSADTPKSEVLADRAQKEIWRALAIILGASNSNVQPCVMRQINSLEDLDAVAVKVPCPEPFPMMGMVANHLGLSRVMRATYRKACEEGWAPAPTNDVQKAIWERVKADKERGPTNPILILPPNQKK